MTLLLEFSNKSRVCIDLNAFETALRLCKTEDQISEYLKVTDPYLAGVFLFANRKENEARALQDEFSKFEGYGAQHYTKYILGSWLISLQFIGRAGSLKEGKKILKLTEMSVG